ncbi:MAG: NAD-dependent epimerase/dehydratase family protein [Spirochaetes bacterium]|nr:NAD-dependent epimerase/dehydratase family protein [Spirochaetota bacterium]
MKETIFITGATGHLGSNLVSFLARKKTRIKLLFRKNSNHPFLNKLKFEKVEGDLLDEDSLMKGMRGCNTVIHCAGFVSYKKKDHKKLREINYKGTKNVIDAAFKNRVRVFVHISSTAAIGLTRNPYEPLTEKAVFKKSYQGIGYMYTKYLAEQYVLGFKNRMKVIILNPSTIIGKGDNHLNTAEVFINLKQGRLKQATPGGNAFVDVEDVVSSIALALKRGRSGERYIISSFNIPFLQFFNYINSYLKREPIKTILPFFTYYLIYPVSFILEFFSNILKISLPITSELMKISYAFRYFDSTKARRDLGWEPEKRFDVSIKQAIQFYSQYIPRWKR